MNRPETPTKPTPRSGSAAVPPQSGSASISGHAIARSILARRRSPLSRYRGNNWPRFMDKLSEPQLAKLIGWLLDPALSYERIEAKARAAFRVKISIQALFRFRTGLVLPALAGHREHRGQPMQVLFTSDEFEIVLRRKSEKAA